MERYWEAECIGFRLYENACELPTETVDIENMMVEIRACGGLITGNWCASEVGF